MQAPTVPTVPTVSFGPANTSAAARLRVQIRPLARGDLITALTALVPAWRTAEAIGAYRRDLLDLP